MGHNVGDAAARSVKKSEKTKTADRTPLDVIADVRRNLLSGLAVPPDDQRFLLAQYDAAQSTVALLGQSTTALLKRAETAEANVADQSGIIGELQSKIEEFRTVYEAENRSTTVKVERVLDEYTDFKGTEAAVVSESMKLQANLEPILETHDLGGEA